MHVLVSYRTKFSDASYDPFNGEYEAIMDTYHVPLQINNAPTPAELSSSACDARSTAAIIPTAFMILQADHKIHLYHFPCPSSSLAWGSKAQIGIMRCLRQKESYFRTKQLQHIG